ncbi:hypothetical protein CERZMDRAFT_98104 [Cercospora zeae-maydis SCOH1-5]|uniref:Uncharacterized protein n=1 Tax=Cercospora zeae-maydis SCOH1-5 TaxID=717836 RepID=A0A6A6FE56_9PEZI|nr:hypothetical protein CERZMDRAFT_98104 [Cercospora zeae-maydis SCOH1-5]
MASRFAARQSLHEQLDNIHQGAEDDPDEYFQMIDAELAGLEEDVEKSKVKLAQAGTKWLKAQGMDLSPQRELVEPEAHPTQGRLVRGSHAHRELPDRHNSVLRVSTDQFEVGKVPDRFKDLLRVGNGSGADDASLQRYLRDDLQRGRDIGSGRGGQYAAQRGPVIVKMQYPEVNDGGFGALVRQGWQHMTLKEAQWHSSSLVAETTNMFA